MFTEVLIGLVVAGFIFFLVNRMRSRVLLTEDGWWGAGPPPDGGEDTTIRRFSVTTSTEEMEVRLPPFCRLQESLLLSDGNPIQA